MSEENVIAKIRRFEDVIQNKIKVTHREEEITYSLRLKVKLNL